MSEIAKFLPEPPVPRDTRTLARWTHTRVRRRMLYGDWERDAYDRLAKTIGHIRRAVWGTPDLSSNVFRSVVTQLATLYDRVPNISHADEGAAEDANGAVRACGLWSLMQRVQRDCLGMREMLVRVDIADDDEVRVRPVFPDLVEADATAEHPDRPIRIKEAILRWRDGKALWTYDEFDIRDPANPTFKVLDERGVDVSAEWDLAGYSGEAYPWRKADGTPILPYVLYHAQQTGCLWDPFEARELVEGTLTICVLWTLFGHVVRNCSWPQRYVVGARIIGEEVDADADGDEATKRREVVSDPAVVVELLADGDVAQILVGQWEPGGDPKDLQEAIALYERRVAGTGGISPADVQRVAGDPRSGFALAITREAQRESQRRFEPCFRRGDEELVALIAILQNRHDDGTRPEDGYHVAYESLPPSAEERQSEREHLLALLDAGLTDRVSIYQQLHPGITQADAMRDLERIRGLNEMTGATAAGGGDDGAAPDAGAALQDTALNGAQVTSLLQVVQATAARQLPRTAAVNIIRRAFGVSVEDAEAMLGDVGTTFFIEPQQVAAAA